MTGIYYLLYQEKTTAGYSSSEGIVIVIQFETKFYQKVRPVNNMKIWVNQRFEKYVS